MHTLMLMMIVSMTPAVDGNVAGNDAVLTQAADRAVSTLDGLRNERRSLTLHIKELNANFMVVGAFWALGVGLSHPSFHDELIPKQAKASEIDQQMERLKNGSVSTSTEPSDGDTSPVEGVEGRSAQFSRVTVERTLAPEVSNVIGLTFKI